MEGNYNVIARSILWAPLVRRYNPAFLNRLHEDSSRTLTIAAADVQTVSSRRNTRVQLC